ncbi:hypothetical protein SprV_0100481100 [Sparganum proliferum]
MRVLLFLALLLVVSSISDACTSGKTGYASITSSAAFQRSKPTDGKGSDDDSQHMKSEQSSHLRINHIINQFYRRRTIQHSQQHCTGIEEPKNFSTQSYDETKTLKALKQDEDIIILPADKGGATTVLNKTDYTDKMMSLLKDDSTYEPLTADPTKSQNSHIEKTLKRLSGRKSITGVLARSLEQDEPTIAKIYGLPKIHKTDIPLRPIVALIGAPNYKISKWLFRQVHPLTKNSEDSIQDSKEFLDKLNGVNITCDEIMVSFDVVSLFTSIPLDLAKSCTEELLQTYTSEVPPEALLQLLDLCLETNFSFSNQCYRQLKDACNSGKTGYASITSSAVFQRSKPTDGKGSEDDSQHMKSEQSSHVTVGVRKA